MARPSSPKKPERNFHSFRLPPYLTDKLRRMSARDGISQNAVVIHLLKDAPEPPSWEELGVEPPTS